MGSQYSATESASHAPNGARQIQTQIRDMWKRTPGNDQRRGLQIVHFRYQKSARGWAIGWVVFVSEHAERTRDCVNDARASVHPERDYNSEKQASTTSSAVLISAMVMVSGGVRVIMFPMVTLKLSRLRRALYMTRSASSVAGSRVCVFIVRNKDHSSLQEPAFERQARIRGVGLILL